jgi:UDP:flavonoid glycosyltransferase YjiC (YdhE family)
VLIRHSGTDSAAQVIHAGAPKVIIASAFDQFFNGHRIQQQGLGSWYKKNAANTNLIKIRCKISLRCR